MLTFTTWAKGLKAWTRIMESVFAEARRPQPTDFFPLAQGVVGMVEKGLELTPGLKGLVPQIMKEPQMQPRYVGQRLSMQLRSMTDSSSQEDTINNSAITLHSYLPTRLTKWIEEGNDPRDTGGVAEFVITLVQRVVRSKMLDDYKKSSRAATFTDVMKKAGDDGTTFDPAAASLHQEMPGMVSTQMGKALGVTREVWEVLRTQGEGKWAASRRAALTTVMSILRQMQHQGDNLSVFSGQRMGISGRFADAKVQSPFDTLVAIAGDKNADMDPTDRVEILKFGAMSKGGAKDKIRTLISTAQSIADGDPVEPVEANKWFLHALGFMDDSDNE